MTSVLKSAVPVPVPVCTGIMSLDSLLNEFALSVPVVFGAAAVLTMIWVGLWVRGPMKDRRVQTWWQLGGYIILFAFGSWRMYAEGLGDYFLHPKNLYDIRDLPSRWTKLFFEIEVAWYVSSLICTLVNREAKDFRAMLFHHLITPVEIYFSYHCPYHGTGLGVMVLHDTSDVFLHAAKAFHHEGLGKITDITFTVFAVVFFVTRLVILPQLPWAFWAYSGRTDFCGETMAATLVVLVLLHSYWFSLIVQMIMKFVKDGSVEGDIRDEDAISKEKGHGKKEQ